MLGEQFRRYHDVMDMLRVLGSQGRHREVENSPPTAMLNDEDPAYRTGTISSRVPHCSHREVRPRRLKQRVEWSVIYWILSARVSLSFALVSEEWVLVSMNCPAGCRLAESQRK
jgi:hypothetical protein